MKQLLSLALFFSTLFTNNNLIAQVGIGTITPDANAQLDITSPDKGLLIPRMTEQARVNMGAASDGLLVYQTDVSKGFYFRQAGAWVKLPNSSGTAIIPYASGAPISMTTQTTGVTDLPVFVGFGSAAQASTALGTSIDQTTGLLNYAFSVPKDGIIESLTAYFSSTSFASALFGNQLFLTAQLYSSNAPSTVFTPVSGAVVNFALTTLFNPGIVPGQAFYGTAADLAIPVPRHTRLLMVYSIRETYQFPVPALFGNVVTGHASGGVSIAGQ